MVHKKRSMFPIEFEFKKLSTTSYLNMDLSISQKDRIMQLYQLDEIRREALTIYNWYRNREKHGMTSS